MPSSMSGASSIALLLLVLTAACAPAVQAPSPAADASAAITAESIHDHIRILASDEMRGRDTPSPGLEAAAEYLVGEHRRAGIQPRGEEGFYQRYPFIRRGLDAAAVALEVSGHPATPRFQYGRDFYLSGGTARSAEAGLLFTGSGDSDSPELRDRIAVVRTPGGWDRAFRAAAGRQARIAEDAGATAIIHVLDRDWPEERIAQLADFFARPGWVLGENVPFPQVFLSMAAAERLFGAADLDLVAVLREAQDPAFRPFPLPGIAVRLAGERAALERASPPNVIGIAPGRDPVLRDEFVVLSAHYDHVGVGEPVNGDSIYNGADDNASGTAALLEIARVISGLPEEERPRRSILFVHVSGEEKGLLGSRWYADNPTVPAGSMVANINIDMIAGDTHRDSVVVIGKGYSDLGPLVDEVNTRHPDLGLVTSDDLWPEQRFFFRSDHFNFARHEIPAIFFFTGVHECYHQPCDSPDFVDPDKAARIARLVYHTTMAIANREARPVWDEAGLEEVRELTR